MYPLDRIRRASPGLALAVLVLTFVCGCQREAPRVSGPLPQRGYLWQRAWTPAVEDSMREADDHLDGIAVLGAEISWQDGVPQPIEATINWEALKSLKKPWSLALRIAPYPGPFAENDATARAITGEAASLLHAAHAHGLTPAEFEVDFDCAQGKLPGYALWLQAIARAVHPTRLVITTLPAWLDEPAFPALIHLVDGYVLQVHSVPALSSSGHPALCDPVLARQWVEKAARLGVPFSVALPTYWCLAGYNNAGKLIGVAMDSVQPNWPAGTRLLEFGPQADEVADLVHGWQASRPSGLQEIIWYRLPVATDLRNWHWPTLLAVSAGRHPEHRLEIVQENHSPVDLSVVNSGDAEEALNCDVVVRWNGPRPLACDALPGWTVSAVDGQAIFSTNDRYHLRLPPGANTSVGWVRLGEAAALHTELIPHEKSTP